MTRPSVYSLLPAKMIFKAGPAEQLAQFLIKNAAVFCTQSVQDGLFKASSPIESPITTLYNQFMAQGDNSLFSLINIPRRSVAIPEALNMSFLPFDMAQIGKVYPHIGSAVESLSTLNDKIVLDVTPLLRSNGTFSNQAQFQRMVVRDVMSRSFFLNDKSTWLTPNLAQFVCKVYSMSLGSVIARWYDLGVVDWNYLTGIMAHFFLVKIASAEQADAVLTRRASIFNLSPEVGATIPRLVQKTLGRPSMDSLEDMFAVIDALGIARIKLNRAVFYSKLKLCNDLHTSALAVEYPPYFLYLMLQVASGDKMYLSNLMKNAQVSRDMPGFLKDLTQSSNVF